MKKFLISVLALIMGVTLAFGLVACGDNENPDEGGNSEVTMTDAEIAEQAMSLLRSQFGGDAVDTPKDYKVLGELPINGNRYTVVWTATAKTEGVTITDYVNIGELDADKRVTVTITPDAVLDVEYTLKATVTVGEVTQSVEFEHRVPHNAIVSSNLQFDFSGITEKGVSLNNATALEAFKAAGNVTTEIVSLQVNNVYAGNGTGNASHVNEGGLLRLGTGSNNGTITLVLDKKVGKVIVMCQSWSTTSNDLITVNGAESQPMGTDVPVAVEFELATPTETVVIETVSKEGGGTSRGFIFNIGITYAEGVHNHTWKYEHAEGGWTHTRVCTAENCDLPNSGSETVNCEPVRNTCICGYTYKEAEILEAFFALASKASLPGTYELTGTITSIEEIQTGDFQNATFNMKVGEREFEVYRASGEGYENIKVGDTVTVFGTLTNYNGTFEFTQGGTISKIVDNSATMSNQEKADAAASVLSVDTAALKAVGGEVTLPATGIYESTITWEMSENTYLELVSGKLTVKSLPESGTADVTLTATVTVGDKTATKTITVTLKAAVTVTHAGTEGDPFTVADVIALCEGLESNAYYNGTTLYYVKGFVTTKGTWSDTYNNFTGTYIADTKGGTTTIQVYRLTLGDLVTSTDFAVGAEVLVYGYIQNYSSGPQVTYSGSTSPVLKSYTAPQGGQQPEPGPGGDTEETVFTPITTPAAGSDYYMSMKIADGKEHYITGSLSSDSYYLTTTTDLASAAKVTLQADGEGWLIIVGGKYLELTISGTHANPVFKDAQTSGEHWEWDSTYNIFTWTDSASSKWFLGTRNDRTYDTIGGCVYTTYVAQNYKAYLGTMEDPSDMTDQDKVNEVLASLNVTPSTFSMIGADADLPTSNSYAAEVVWTVKDHTELVKIEGNTLTVTALPNETTTVTLHVVVTLNGAKAEKDVTITCNPADPFKPITEPKEGIYYFATIASDGKYHYITGGMQGYYYATTTDHAASATVQLIPDDSGWLLKTSKNLYIEVELNESHTNAVYKDERTTGKNWTWDDEKNIFYWTEGSTKYFLGTYNTYTTISASSYSNVDTNYHAVLGNYGDEVLTPPSETQSIAIYDPAGNDLAGKTIELPKNVSGKGFHGLMIYPTILPLTAPQEWTHEESNTKLRVVPSGKSLEVSTNPNNAAVGDETTITITATGTELSATVTIKTVEDADQEYVSKYHGYSVDDPLTADELTALCDKIGQGRTLSLDAYCYYYLEGVVTRIENPDGGETRAYNSKIYFENSKGKEIYVLYGMTLDEVKKEFPDFTRDTLKVGDTLIVSTQWALNSDGVYADQITTGTRVFKYKPAGGTAPDEKTDQDKVNEVLASLQLPKTTFSSLPDDADLPTSNSYEAEVVWTVKDTTDLVKIEGNLLTVLKLPTEETTVKLHVVVTLNEATAEKDFDIKIEPAETTNYGTKDAPITVTQALAIAKALPTGKEDANYSAEAAYVKGYVVDAGSWVPASGSYSAEYKSAYIADSKDSTASSADAIQIFYLHVDDTFLKLEGDLIKGAELTVYGYIQHFAYNAGGDGIPEISDHGSVKVSAVAYTVTEQQKADAAVAAVGDLSSASVTEDVDLPDSTVTGVTFEWKVSDTEGTNAKIEDGKVVITRTEADATVTLTLTATCGSATVTKTYTLKILSSSAAEAELLYTLNSNEQPVGTNNNYANTCEVTYNGVTWVVAGNAKVDSGGAQKPWRFGGKSITKVDRTLTGKTAIPGKISKVTLQLTDGGSITVNSVTLKVYRSDPTVSGAELVSTKSITYQKGVAVNVSADSDDWTNCCFQIVFNLTVSGNSNKFVSIDKLEFWGFNA